MRTLASADYRYEPVEGAKLPSLEAELESLCRERFRRADRFIQLALLGSARCAQGRTLAPRCGLYLSSGLGPVGNNLALQQQLCRDKVLPKPFNFINTLGSSSGYYVAKNLGIAGPNLFISRRNGSFEAAMALAEADLEAGMVAQALVGVVEECTLPLDEHRARQRLAGVSEALVESSHWVLLER